MSGIQRPIYIISRTALAAIFLYSSVNKILHWHMTAGYMAAKGMPAVPFFLLGAIILELGGSIMLVSGFKPRLGALMLIIFLIPATLIFHNFWAATGPEHQMQLSNFLKNLGILGGLGIVLSTPINNLYH